MQSLKAVVFGGAGFLGSHVADCLTERGYAVTLFDQRQSPYLKEGQEMFIGSVLDEDAVKKVLRGADYIYHFAGIADLDDATTQPIETIRLNIEGTSRILEAARHEKPKRFVYASTIYVYSEKGGFYRCSKQSAELYIEEFQRKYSIDFTILRYGTLYGPRATSSNSVYRYVSQALKDGVIVYDGTGDEMREYIHVCDAAKLSADILSDAYRNKHVIVTGHHPMKFKHLLEMINEILGNKIKMKNVGASDSVHYTLTPYSFNPKIGMKLTSNCYIDMGQGLLECCREIAEQLKK